MNIFTKKFSSQGMTLVIIWLLGFCANADTAAKAETVAKAASNKDISAFTNWPIILLVLMGMIGLILALAWFVKRFGGMNFSGNREMKVVTSIALGARERVALIDIKGQQFLLGVTTQQISHLHSFDEPVIPTDEAKKAINQHDFAAKLQAVLNPAKANKTSEQTSSDQSSEKVPQGRDGHAS